MIKKIDRILIIRPCAIGDFVQTLPALKVLRENFSNAYVEILGKPSIVELAKGRFYADNTSNFDRGDISPLFLSGSTDFPKQLAAYITNFDLIVSYLKDSGNTFTDNLKKIGAANVISFDPLPYARYCNHHSNTQDNKPHIIDHLLKPVLSLNKNGRGINRTPNIFPTKDDKAFASDYFKKYGLAYSAKLAAIHPGSGSAKKNWPLLNFAKTAKYLLANYKVKLLLISGPADGQLAEEFKNCFSSNEAYEAKSIPLPQLAAILEKVDCFIGNDSGISHIAASVGTPTISIFGPTEPEIWAPRGKNVRIVKGQCPQSPPNPDCKTGECLNNVDIDKVINHASKAFS